jgi:ribulose 1,5-bisphosphate carboxylase large subunit-like protein
MGNNAECRDNVAYPLKRIRVGRSLSQFAGNCFVYRYIDGIQLGDFMFGKDYVEHLLITNQIMPQLIKGYIKRQFA